MNSGEVCEDIMPVVGVASTVLFPGMTCTLLLGTLRAYGAVREAHRTIGPAHVAVCSVPDREADPTHEGPAPLCPTGVLARVFRLRQHETGLWIADFRAQARVHVTQFLREHPFRLARVKEAFDESEETASLEALVDLARERLCQLKRQSPACSMAAEVLAALVAAQHLHARIAALMGCLTLLPLAERQAALESNRVSARLECVLNTLEARLDPLARPAGPRPS
ncbi:MAG: LON peptidase substrate-binding domain-containing protein [Myxococcales bacterium]|nr:LON peptidase substrate-binding domain-containing protein [Myxococcales bacterium]